MRIYVRDWHGRFAEVPGGKRLAGLVSVKTNIYGHVSTHKDAGFGKLSGRTVFQKSKITARPKVQPKKAIATHIAIKTNIYGKVRTANDPEFGKLSGRTVFQKSSLAARPKAVPKFKRESLISVKTNIYGHVRTANDPGFKSLSGRTVFQKSSIGGRGIGTPAGGVKRHDARGPAPVPPRPKEPSKPALAHYKFAAIRDREPIRQELERQATLTPKAMKRLRKVTDQPGDQDHQVADNALAYYQPRTRSIHMRPVNIPDQGDRFSQPVRLAQIDGKLAKVRWHTPCGHDHNGLQATLAHEYGHHVTFMMDGMHQQQGTRAKAIERNKDLQRLNEALREFGGPDDWIAFGSYRRDRLPDRVKEEVSEYGATNLNEMMAEVWAEYSSHPNPRPKIKKLGALMQELVEKYQSRIPLQDWEKRKQLDINGSADQ